MSNEPGKQLRRPSGLMGRLVSKMMGVRNGNKSGNALLYK
jgi:hypothetical protein